jgi:flavin-dependent dehydrogenase
MAPRWLDIFTGPADVEMADTANELLARPKQPTSPMRHFRDLVESNPSLTESQLVNANNRVPYTAKADVVVGGGGVLGLVYAIHLKTIMPHLDIAVFEKGLSPQYKIGESTLSSFMRFLNTDVCHSDYLLRLFGVKDGLDFFWVDEAGSRPITQDLGNLEASLQLDRRVSDLFLTMWAQKLGVRVYHGVGVDYEVEVPADAPPTDSVVREILLKDSGKSLGISSEDGEVAESKIEARYVCDASGFACRITSKVGQKETFDGWNTDSVWAYFKPQEYSPPEGEEDELLDWDYAAGKHICFAEGWGWFIKLISWHKAPLANLMDMLTHFIDLAITRTPLSEMPSTIDLAKMFECPFEFITSIGWVVRDDAPPPPPLPATEEYKDLSSSERRFLEIQKKYPVLDRLMTKRYKLLPGYYHGRTYFVRKQLAFRRSVVAGVNWFAFGNSTGFTNPLISPGINAGIVGAMKSAELTAGYVQADDVADPAYSEMIHAKTRAEYQTYIHDYVVPRLDMLNRFWYNAFRDGRLFEAAIVCYWPIATDNRDYLSYYFGPSDYTWIVGAGGPAFAEFCSDIMPLITGPCDGKPVADEIVDEVRVVCRRWLDKLVAKNPQKWSVNQRCYDDNLVRVPGKTKRTMGHFHLIQCRNCKYWKTPTLPACQICGTKNKCA